MGSDTGCVYSTMATHCVYNYDRLKGKVLLPLQQAFVDALSPQKPSISFPDVQKQSNNYDCGVSAIAYASSIALKRNPAFENYKHSGMRPHLLRLLESKELIQFPSTPRKPRGNPKRDIFVVKNLQEKKITKAEQKRA